LHLVILIELDPSVKFFVDEVLVLVSATPCGVDGDKLLTILKKIVIFDELNEFQKLG
jgi:hypothetical protein